MKQFIKNSAFVLLMLLVSPHPASANGDAGEQSAIRGLMQQWLTAYNSKDIDSLLSLYSDKIYFANNGNSVKKGIAAIRQNFAAQFKASPKTTIDFVEEIVTVGEALAHIAGKYRVNIPQADGNTAHAYGRVLLIFEKEKAQWKLVVDFDNTATDIAAADFTGN